jgi:hypothetical protein
VLLVGYKNEANHLLKSKCSRLEVEDMVHSKFDDDRGVLCERDIKAQDKRLNQYEEKLKLMNDEIQKFQT